MTSRHKHRFASFWLAASVLLPAAALAQDGATPAPAAPAAAPAAPDPGRDLSAKVAPFLQKNCFACHSSTIATGGIDVQGTLQAPNSLNTWRETWEAIASALSQNQMPPPNMPRPAQADIDATVTAIRTALAANPPPAPKVATIAPTTTKDWLTFGYDPERTNWNRSETAISKATAPKLQLLWKYQTGEVPNPVNRYSTLTEAVVVGGVDMPGGKKDVVYVGGHDDVIFALDKHTGALLWKKSYPNNEKPPVPPSGNCPENMNATPVVDRAKGIIYFLTNDGNLRGISLTDGADKFPATPMVPPFTRNFSLNLVNGHIFTGTTRGCAGAASEVAEIDVDGPNHAAHHFYTSPGKGSGPWGRGGIVHTPYGWVTQTADGAYDPAGGRWAMSLLNFSDDDAVIDSFTMPNWYELNARDMDFGSSSPTVFEFGGRPIVASSSKSGIIYLSDAQNLGGRTHMSTLYTSPRYSNDADTFGFTGLWSVMSTYVDAAGKRWLYVPFYGPEAKATAGSFKKNHGPTVNGQIMAFTVEGTAAKPVLVPQWMSADLDQPGVVTVANGVLLILANGDRGSTLIPAGARRGGGGGGANNPEGGGGGGNANTPRTPPVAIVNPALPDAAADQAWYNSQFRPYAQGGQQGGSRFSGGRDTTHAILYALDPATGDEIYNSKDAITSWNHYGELALSDGMVFTTTYDGEVFAFGLKK